MSEKKKDWATRREIAHVAVERLRKVGGWFWLGLGIGLRENNHIVQWNDGSCYMQHKWNLLISCARDRNNSLLGSSCVFISIRKKYFPQWMPWAWFFHRTKNQVIKFRLLFFQQKRFWMLMDQVWFFLVEISKIVTQRIVMCTDIPINLTSFTVNFFLLLSRFTWLY